MHGINITHDPLRRSWVESANGPGDFPIQNLPFGVFRRAGSRELWRTGVAIGDRILDLHALYHACPLEGAAAVALSVAQGASLNAFMGLTSDYWSALRLQLSDLLSSIADGALRKTLQTCLVAQCDAELTLPAEVGDYSDFFTSYHHALNSGRINRPNQVLSPSFKFMPIGYHGRASTLICSGTAVRRPLVQTREGGCETPEFGACRMLDYEGELGFYVGSGNAQGEPIPIADIQRHLFGFSILNDWSARDAQTWEKFGSGPLLCKDFATSLSPWIVTMEAVAPFRMPRPARPEGDPPPLAYLESTFERESGAIDVTLEVALLSENMRNGSQPAQRLSHSHFGQQYFTIGQIAAHHASNGCRLRPGDLLGSGTISNEAADSWGCMMELTQRGRKPLTLANGEERSFLEDGDEVVISAYCERDGFVRIGVGECRGRVVPAPSSPTREAQ
jgi:fumarylacetoacetase